MTSNARVAPPRYGPPLGGRAPASGVYRPPPKPVSRLNNHRPPHTNGRTVDDPMLKKPVFNGGQAARERAMGGQRQVAPTNMVSRGIFIYNYLHLSRCETGGDYNFARSHHEMNQM